MRKIQGYSKCSDSKKMAGVLTQLDQVIAPCPNNSYRNESSRVHVTGVMVRGTPEVLGQRIHPLHPHVCPYLVTDFPHRCRHSDKNRQFNHTGTKNTRLLGVVWDTTPQDTVGRYSCRLSVVRVTRRVVDGTRLAMSQLLEENLSPEVAKTWATANERS